METKVVRVRRDTLNEVQSVGRLMGQSPAELIREAWDLYKDSEGFRARFEYAQKALSVEDVGALTERLEQGAEDWASTQAERIRRMRD